MFRRGSFFWGGLLVLAGVLLLLQNMGVITGNIWGIIWPLVLILIGVQLLLSVTGRARQFETQRLTIPVNGANQAAIRFNHGAGRLRVYASADPGALVSGSFDGGVEVYQNDQGPAKQVDLAPAISISGIFHGDTGTTAAWSGPSV
jgi:hypothetical protein